MVFIAIEDFETGKKTDLQNDEVSDITLPKAEMSVTLMTSFSHIHLKVLKAKSKIL